MSARLSAPFALALALLLAGGAAAAQGEAAPGFRARLADEGGAPLAGWWVGVLPRPLEGVIRDGRVGEELAWSREVRTDAEGRFAFEPPPAFLLVVRSPDARELAVREAFRLGPDEAEIRLRSDERVPGFLQGTLSLGGEALPSGARVEARSEDGFELARARRDGAVFRLGPLRPGTHFLTATVPGRAPARRVARVLASATADLGEWRLEPPGRIATRFELAGFALEADEVVTSELLRDGELACGLLESRLAPAADADRVPHADGLSEPLDPGRYVLRTRGAGWRAADRLVDVPPGGRVEASLALVRATERTLRVLLPSDDPSTHLHLTVHDVGGRVIQEEELRERLPGDRFEVRARGLTRGFYSVEVKGPSGLAGHRRFEVVYLRPEPEPIDVAMH